METPFLLRLHLKLLGFFQTTAAQQGTIHLELRKAFQGEQETLVRFV